MLTEVVWRASVDGSPAPELDMTVVLYNGVPNPVRTKALLAEWGWLAKDMRPVLRRFFDRKYSVPSG